jgi:hypothetical protein
MTDDVEGLEEQLSVGFLELTEDLLNRLPVRSLILQDAPNASLSLTLTLTSLGLVSSVV